MDVVGVVGGVQYLTRLSLANERFNCSVDLAINRDPLNGAGTKLYPRGFI